MKRNYTPSSFAKHLEDFLSVYAPTTEGVSLNTVASYCSTFRQLLSFNSHRYNIHPDSYDLKNLTLENVEAFLNWVEQDCGCKTVTRNQRLAAVHAFCTYLIKKEPIFIYQLQQILALKNKKHPTKTIVDYLTVEETAAITKSVDITAINGLRDVVLLCLMYDSAARVQEIADLTVGDVKLYGKDTSFIYITGKGQKTRSVPITTPTFEMLTAYFKVIDVSDKNTPLFLNRDKEKLTRHGISLILKKYVEKAKCNCSDLAAKKISPHTFRHSKAMHMLQEGVDLIKIRDLLGHESITTTEIYVKTNDNDLRIESRAQREIVTSVNPSWHKDPGIMAKLASFGKK